MSLVRFPVRRPVGLPVRSALGDVSGSLLSRAKSALGGIAPYHYLDFANDEALQASADVGGVADFSGYSFARASSGYYTNSDGTLTSFASGALRTGDRGVLIEGVRTNLITASYDFDNGGWLKAGVSITANTTAAPDGTTTADTITEDISGARHFTYRAIITVVSTVYTHSIYVKAGTRSVVAVGLRSTNGATGYVSTFNLSTGELGTAYSVGSPTSTSRSIEALGNGWYRCAVTAAAATTGTFFEFGVSDSVSPTWFGAMPSYTGDGTSGVYIWGAQVEAGACASSYIPTTSTSVTRAADVLTYSLAETDYPLSLFAEFERAGDTGGLEILMQIDNGSNADSAAVFINVSDRLQVNLSTSTVPQAQMVVTGASMPILTNHKTATRLAANDAIVAANGTLAAQDTSVTVPATPDRLSIPRSDYPLLGYVKRIAIFNSALSDTDLQDITE